MPKVFISHSWEDKAIARKIAENLRRDGAEVWIDYARIEGGDSLPKVIGQAIQWCDTLILVWSKSAEASYFVGLEWECALTNQKRIIPCLIDEAVLPLEFIIQLNRNKFADYWDWRLPTLEEAMSLTEPEKKNGNLYIDPKFDQMQRWIWTSDTYRGESWAWVVSFDFGRCSDSSLYYKGFVRAVRSGQLSGGY